MAVLRQAVPEAKTLEDIVRKQLAAHKLPIRRVDVPPDGGCAIQAQWLDLTSLEGLRGLPITELDLQGCRQVTSLEPLRGMQLTKADFGGCAIDDLAPLQGMPLRELRITGCRNLVDLAPLAELPLVNLNVSECGNITDISALAKCPIERFACVFGGIKNIADIRQWPIRSLALSHSKIQDISPLRGLPLTHLSIDGLAIRDYSPLAFCQKIESLQIKPSAFADAATAALQIGENLIAVAVTQKGAHPGFDIGIVAR
jgi:hypothetical protein